MSYSYCEINGHDFNQNKSHCYRCQAEFRKITLKFSWKPTEPNNTTIM